VNVDVLIVGAGPAGLAAAIELRRLGVGRVLVADREQQAGGVPRHSAHTGYGLRDLHRVMTGPAYARHYAESAARVGAEIRPSTTVTALDSETVTGTSMTADRQAILTSPAGIDTVAARAVLLATGCRERPRSARLVPGDRPPGVMTTGELQQRVYLAGQRLPGRALVIGAEHVSFSAMVTLAHAGAEVIALVTDQPRHQSYAAFALGASARWRVPVWTSTAVRRVDGRGRLAGVELASVRTGATRFVACDTLVFTGDWIPDHELARLAGVVIDPGTRGPAVDTGLETSVSRVFAAGNLVHAAETADIAALGGRHAARQIAVALAGAEPQPPNRTFTRTGAEPAAASHLRGRFSANTAEKRPRYSVPITVGPPLAWISPNVIRDTAMLPPRGRFLLRSEVFVRRARLEVHQDDRILARARASLVPGRPVHLDANWLARVDPFAGPVRVLLR